MRERLLQQPSNTSDEIDLVELFKALWRQKALIAGTTALVTLIAAAYAFLATPYYKTQTFLRPVEQSSLDQLNETGIYKLTPEEALARVASGLSSYENRLQFFLQNRELFQGLDIREDAVEQSFATFNEEAFTMLHPDPKRTDNRSAYVGLALTYPKGVDGASIVNGFASYVLDLERKEIAEDLDSLKGNRLAGLEMKMEAGRANYSAAKEAQIAMLQEQDALKKAQLRDELAALRDQLKIRRQNRIQELDEAIVIAESLGIRTPTTPSVMADARHEDGQVIRTEITNRQVPLYFLGADALKAERDTLLARTSDDFAEPRVAEIQTELALLERNREVEILLQRQDEQEDLYLKNLADWREEAARLKGIKLDTDRLRLVRLDQPALQPRTAIKPKKAMIVALGLVLGAMLAIFIALVRAMVARSAPAARP